MNKLHYKLIPTLLLVFISATSFAQFTDTKSVTKRVALNPGGKVSVSNKGGSIQIISWAKDSVVIHATVSGSSKSLVKLQEAMNA